MPFTPTQERTQVSQRRTVDNTQSAGSGAAAFAKTVGALSQHFSSVASQATENAIATEKAKNEAILEKMKVGLQANLKDAREATRTGDYSKFTDFDLAKSATLSIGVPEFVGTIAADEDKLGLTDVVNKLPPSRNVDQAIGEFIAEQTRGMNPIATEAYRQELTKIAGPIKNNRMKAIEDANYADIKKSVPTVIDRALKTGDIHSVDDVLKLATKVASTSTKPIAKTYTEVRDLMFRAMMDQAQDGKSPASARAAFLLTQDMGDGISIATIHRDMWDEVTQKNLTSLNRHQTVTAQKVVRDMNLRLQNFEVNPGDDTLGKMLVDLDTRYTKVGNRFNTEYQSTRGKIIKAMELKANALSGLNEWRERRSISNLSNKRLKATVVEAERANPQMALEIQRKYGSIDTRKQANSNAIMGGDVEAGMTSLLFLKTGNRPMTDHVGKGAPFMMFHGLEYKIQTQGMSAAKEFQPKLAEAIAKNDGSFENHFQKRIALRGEVVGAGGGRDPAQQGVFGIRNFAKEIWDDIDDDTRKKWGIADGQDYDDLPDNIRRDLNRKINMASLISSVDADDSLDNVRAIAKSMMQGQYEHAVVNGKITTVQRRTPERVVDVLGRPQAGSAFTEEHAEAFIRFTEENPVMKSLAENFGANSIQPDAQTARDGTMQVQLNVNGFKNDFVLHSAAELTDIPVEWVQPGGVLHGAFTVVDVDDDGNATINVPPPEEGNESGVITLNNNLSLQWDAQAGTNGGWRMRYSAAPDVSNEDAGMLTQLLQSIGIGVPSEEEAHATFESLDQASKERVNRIRQRIDPITMSDERLRIIAQTKPGTPGIADEIRRRREGGSQLKLPTTSEEAPMPPGTAAALTDDTETVPSHRDAVELGKQKRAALEEGADKGAYSTGAVQRTLAALGFDLMPMEEAHDTTLEGSMIDGSMIDDQTGPVGKQFANETVEFIGQQEGLSLSPYKDPFKSGGKVVSSWSVGYGFNLSRPDANEMLAKVGAPSKKELISGGAKVTKDQADSLLKATTGKTVAWLKDHFKGVAMESHRWKALISLAYNSKWNNNGPTLIGPRLTKAIKAGDWSAATFEIRHRSAFVDNKAARRAIALRREREALMFAGAEN